MFLPKSLGHRAIASLTVPGGQEFHFPHFVLKFRSIFLILPQTYLLFFLIGPPSGRVAHQGSPWYATARAQGICYKCPNIVLKCNFYEHVRFGTICGKSNFSHRLLNTTSNLKILLHYVTHMKVVNWRTLHFVFTDRLTTGKNEKEYSWHVPAVKSIGMKQLV